MIDVFSHFVPRVVLTRFRELVPDLPALAAFEALPELWDVDARLRSLDRGPDVQQILNFGNPPVETFGPAADAAELATLVNDELAAISEAHRDRFPAFTAVLPMSDVGLALAELERSHDQLGARGIQVYTNVLGAPLSDPQFRPLFAEMAARDLPVLIHPYRTALVADYAQESSSHDEVWFTFGWPYETSACAARLVFSGIFEELPDLKIVLHHYGGMIPAFAARLDLGFQQIFTGPDSPNPVAAAAGLTGTVGEHYRRFYADTAVNGLAAAVRVGYAFFGTDRTVLGSDAPFCQDGGPAFVAGAVKTIDALNLPAADRNRIVGGNARKLFKLEAPDRIDAGVRS